MALTPKQRRYLKSLAHHLDPAVKVGKGRLSTGLVAEVERSIEAHELIKVRLEIDDGGARRDAADRLASETNADLVGTVGKIAIFYRPRAEDPKIELP
ncbi:MAG TPA: ribosome assembly RNA-binding protein YhbY [Thermoanaerobaculia bacterium]